MFQICTIFTTLSSFQSEFNWETRLWILLVFETETMNFGSCWDRDSTRFWDWTKVVLTVTGLMEFILGPEQKVYLKYWYRTTNQLPKIGTTTKLCLKICCSGSKFWDSFENHFKFSDLSSILSWLKTKPARDMAIKIQIKKNLGLNVN